MEEIKKELDKYRLNPLLLQEVWIKRLEAVHGGGKTMVDPSNPFNQLMEATCYNTSMFIQSNEIQFRRIYRSLSANRDDLYYHLSDKDFVGLFAMPSSAKFQIGFGLGELKEKAVKEDGSDTRKLVIPRNTVFGISGYRFTLQYPIELRVMAHGGLQVVYQTDQPSPLEKLETNQLDYEIVRLPESNNEDFLLVEIPVQQIRITPSFFEINKSVGLIKEVTFEDQFCFARAWLSTDNGGWQEIGIVHQDIVHNLKEMALSIKVDDNRIRVELPPVYLNAQTSGRTIRLDVYTTRGKLDLDMSGFPLADFTVEWLDLNEENHNKYSAPLDNYSAMFVGSEDRVDGGKNGIDYETLRRRVLNNAQGDPALPITPHQTEGMVDLRDYSLVQYVDNLPDRIYQVARSLPAPTTGQLSTGAVSTIRTVEFGDESIRLHPDVHDNGDSITITPNLLYEDTDNRIRVLDRGEVEGIKAQTNDVIVNEVNSRNFLYTPFYYVIDEVNGHYEARAYHLDAPDVKAKSFIEENDTTGLLVSTGSWFVTKKSWGYCLTVVTRSGESTKALADDRLLFQLSYIPPGESQRAYVNGTIREVNADGERVVDFEIRTNYRIDRKDRMVLTNFQMFDDTYRELPIPLLQNFDLMVYAKNHTYPGMVTSEIDNKLAGWLADGQDWVGLSNENFKVLLGRALKYLWCELHPVPGNQTYQTWATDQLKYYTEDVVELDADGHPVLTDDGNGGVTENVLHRAGDPVLDSEGEPVYEHRAGTLKHVNGEPVLEKDRDLHYLLEIYLVEGLLRFSTDPQVNRYRDSLPTIVSNWLEEDLERFSQRLLERTEIYLHPRNELGEIPVVVGENRDMYIRAEQSLTVTYHLAEQQYNNVDLRQSLEETARQEVVKHLEQTTLSIAAMVTAIHEKVKGSILNVNVEGLGGAANYAAVTLTNPLDRCSIRKTLINQPNRVLTITDSVQVKFVRHKGI